jgi:hypothetical protein
LSADAVTMRAPSGLKAAELTKFSWPRRTAISVASEQARELLDSIDTTTLVGLRDRALISVMVFAFARIGAVVGEVLLDSRLLEILPQSLDIGGAIRMCFDWLVTGGILATNPAHAVRGPKHVVKRGKTTVLTGGALAGFGFTTTGAERHAARKAIARPGAGLALTPESVGAEPLYQSFVFVEEDHPDDRD